MNHANYADKLTSMVSNISKFASFVSGHSNSPVNKIVIGILITAAFVVIVFMLICKKRFPIKTKVPKPVLMIPLEDLKPNLVSLTSG